ncbi:MAG TPA: hypothetical protein VK753_04880 [Xanthomonadaceae bacterium]|jgi:hypothetical protein|nr:hypothetical protein [Xanthomonadaceae bacterium]
MLAKLTSKNQLTLPKAATAAVGAAEYFDVETRDGRIILTPVRILRTDGVRAKLAELSLSQTDIDDAVAWGRQRVAEPQTDYATKPASGKPKATATPARKAARKTGRHSDKT